MRTVIRQSIVWLACTVTSAVAQPFPEMGIAPGVYGYQGNCAESPAPDGRLGPMSFVFDGRSLNSANSQCRIISVDLISAGYLNDITDCVSNKTGEKTRETYTLVPDQTGKARVRLEATYVNGVLMNQGNPGWFHLCARLKAGS